MKTRGFIGLGIVAIIANVIIWGGLIFGGIFFIFWCLKHLGVLG